MHEAVLIVSFGGPEKPEDVLPFLENVTRGRNIPRERLLEVAGHYHHLGGKSPINDQCRALITALRAELDAHGIELPIYWGNRNWHPFLADTLKQMRDDGITGSPCLHDFGVQFLLGMPAIPGKHCNSSGSSWRGRAEGGQAAGFL